MKKELEKVIKEFGEETFIEALKILGYELIDKEKFINRNNKSIQNELQVSQENGVKAFGWALTKMEIATDRFIFTEKFLLELQSSFWKRFFCKYYIQKHLKEILSHFSD